MPPEKVIEVQSLIGDSTDNVPGVPGIGVKTAAQLIVEYGDLETLLARAGEIKQEKRRQSLIDNAEQARISKRLVTLDSNVELDVPIDDLAVHRAGLQASDRLSEGDGIQHADPAGRGSRRDRRRRGRGRSETVAGRRVAAPRRAKRSAESRPRPHSGAGGCCSATPQRHAPTASAPARRSRLRARRAHARPRKRSPIDRSQIRDRARPRRG